MVELIMLIIIIVEQPGFVPLHKRKYLLNNKSFRFSFLFRANTRQPQQEVSDRHQVDDVDSNHNQSNTPTSSHGATARPTVPAAPVVDDLGPLPPGWQMSKTENERLFFIDHINKRTTWVKNFQMKVFLFKLFF